jgi:membrane-associated protein
MTDFWELIKSLTDSKEIITVGGVLLILLIIYLENGVFVAFFLPGDYLLFLSGMFAIDQLEINPWLLALYIAIAAILGSFTGYIFGRVVGRQFLKRPNSLFFKYEYLVKTRLYFMKYGGKTLIVSKFLPVVRTFAPILAGIVEMQPKRFLLNSAFGSAFWAFVLVLAGYYLGVAFPDLAHHVEYVVFFFLGITTIILVRGMMQVKKQKPVAQ